MTATASPSLDAHGDARAVGAQELARTDLDQILQRVVVELPVRDDGGDLALHRRALVLGDPPVHQMMGDGDERDAGDREGAQHDGGEDDGCCLHRLARSLVCPKTLGWV
jgi:hypothetical protein